jgi:serine protease Do
VGAQGIGFAIPIDEALDVAARLLSADRMGQVAHGIQGKVEFVDNDRGGKEPRFVVSSVKKDTAADKAGLQSGDRVVKIGSRAIDRALDVELAFLGRHSGDELTIEVARSGQTHQMALAVMATSRVARQNLNERAWTTLGMKLEPISKDEFTELNSHYRGGLRVTAVRPDGPATDQGIRKGDVLVGMHVWQTVSLDNVSYILDRDDLETLQPLLFYILREGDTLFGHLRVAKRKE